MKEFTATDLNKLFKPRPDSRKGENGQVTVIGGSSLFHGAPLLAVKTASRLTDITFFASPEPQVLQAAAQVKGQLSSFIWVPWLEIERYLEKSDAVLIGPGLPRYHGQIEKCQNNKVCDKTGAETKKISERLLKQFPDKQWVIDAGTLQVMSPKFIPPKAILTPNLKEFKMFFGGVTQVTQIEKEPDQSRLASDVSQLAKKYDCVILLKNGSVDIVASPDETCLVHGGNAGLTKGGTGDVLAGLAVALAVNNPPFLAACAASYLLKKAGENLADRVGFVYNADDLAEEVPHVLGRFIN